MVKQFNTLSVPSESVRSHPLRGTPKNAAEGTGNTPVHMDGGQLLATAAAGVGNACSLSFQRPRALGDRRGGKRACATIALRHDER